MHGIDSSPVVTSDMITPDFIEQKADVTDLLRTGTIRVPQHLAISVLHL